MTTYATVGQYVVLVGVAGAIYFISQRKSNKSPRTKVTTKQAKAAVEKQKPAKAKKARKDGGISSGDQGSNDKTSKKNEIQATPVQATHGHGDSDESDGVNNKEFAKQFTSAKSGTLLPSKTADSGRQKSVKQSKAQEKAATFETNSDATGPSSAAGGDADDDRSSANSPDFGATTVDSPVTNGGIDDMLEAPAPGPGVLKITAPTNPSQPKKAKTQSAPEPAETKKQRQNRKKAEEKKAIREEEEKQRKVALEKQRRTAREAEGRAAKDGSTFMASQAPASSAWTGPKGPVNGNESASKAKVELLDTYEPSSSKATASSNSESEQISGDWQKIASTLPEEEQMRRALEESDNWETVKEKRSKKKLKTTQSPPQEKSETDVFTEQPRQRTPQAVKPVTVTEPVAKSHVQREPEVLQDSEWDVAGYGDN